MSATLPRGERQRLREIETERQRVCDQACMSLLRYRGRACACMPTDRQILCGHCVRRHGKGLVRESKAPFTHQPQASLDRLHYSTNLTHTQAQRAGYLFS